MQRSLARYRRMRSTTRVSVTGGASASKIFLIRRAHLLERYPKTVKTADEPIDFNRTMGMMKNPFALGFSLAIFLYVAAECAVYVWMPTYLDGYSGTFTRLAKYAPPIFFILRAFGRFLGAWVLRRFNWTSVMALFSLAILICFAGAVAGGMSCAVWLLPLSGLLMSMIYPTLNSKGISCFLKAEHGAVSGVILFFTCAAAALGPMAMGAVIDAFGHPKYAFVLAGIFTALLFAGLLLNWIYNPARDSRGSLLLADPSLFRWRMEAAIPDIFRMTPHLATRLSRCCRRGASPAMRKAPS